MKTLLAIGVTALLFVGCSASWKSACGDVRYRALDDEARFKEMLNTGAYEGWINPESDEWRCHFLNASEYVESVYRRLDWNDERRADLKRSSELMRDIAHADNWMHAERISEALNIQEVID